MKMVQLILPDRSFPKVASAIDDDFFNVYGRRGDYSTGIEVSGATLLNAGYIEFLTPLEWDETIEDAVRLAMVAQDLVKRRSPGVLKP